MTDPTEIARVAAGLTRAQRDLVLSKGQAFGMPMSAIASAIRSQNDD